MEAEPGSSLATRLPHDEAEWAGATRPARAPGRAQGGFAVNSGATRHDAKFTCRPSAGISSEEIKQKKYSRRAQWSQYRRWAAGTGGETTPRPPPPPPPRAL